MSRKDVASRVLVIPLALFVAACGSAGSSPDATGDAPIADATGAEQVADLAGDGVPAPLEVPLLVGRTVDPAALGADVTAVQVVDGRLPFGLYVTWRGRLEGRPVLEQNATARLRLTPSGAEPREIDVTFEVRGAAPAILVQASPVGQVGQAYQAAFRTSFEASQALQWTVQRGDLPPGLQLDDATGLVHGVPTADGVYPFVLAAQGEGAVARRTVAIRVGPTRLRAFADAFVSQALAENLPNGLVLSRNPQGVHQDYGDAGMWTGTFLAGAAWRYAVEGSEPAREVLAKVLAGTTTERVITGVEGLTARGFEHDEWQGNLPEPQLSPQANPECHDATVAGYEGWRWRGDTSRDQVVGLLLGNQLAHALGDEALAREAAENLVRVPQHIWDHGMRIVDPDGQQTKYGALSARNLEGLPLPNGMNAAMFGGWALAARRAAPDLELDVAPFDAMVAQILDAQAPPAGTPNADEYDYVGVVEKPLYAYAGYNTQWFNVNLTSDALFGLVTGLPDGAARDRVMAAWTTQLWRDTGTRVRDRRAQSEANPWFTYLYFAATAAYEVDPAYEALAQLVAFPPPPRVAVAIANADRFPHDPDQPSSSLESDGPWAAQALPVAERCTGTNFVWQRNPYQLDCGGRVGDRFAGTDFLAPYWLGVFYGYVAADL